MTSSEPPATEEDGDLTAADAERDRLVRLFGGEAWPARVFREVGAWEWLVPWPLGYMHYLYRRIRFGDSFGVWMTSTQRVDDNPWMTMAVGLWLAVVFLGHAHLDIFEAKYASDSAKTLFAGAFLLGTILSVSVAMPGQSIAKMLLARDPKHALHFILPLFWGFLWGVVGAVLMAFFPALRWVVHDWPRVTRVLRAAATFVALYGAFMELNAIMQTVRSYLLGMLLWSGDLADGERKKRAEAAAGGNARKTAADAPIKARVAVALRAPEVESSLSVPKVGATTASEDAVNESTSSSAKHRVR